MLVISLNELIEIGSDDMMILPKYVYGVSGEEPWIAEQINDSIHIDEEKCEEIEKKDDSHFGALPVHAILWII